MKDKHSEESYLIQTQIIGQGIKFLLKNGTNTSQVYQSYLENFRQDQKLAQFFQNVEQLKSYMDQSQNLIINYDLKSIQIVASMQNRDRSKKITLCQFHLKPIKLNLQIELQNVIKRCQQTDNLNENQIKDFVKLFAKNMLKSSNYEQQSQQKSLNKSQMFLQVTSQRLKEQEKSISLKQVNNKLQSLRLQLKNLNKEIFYQLQVKLKEHFAQKIERCEHKCDQGRKIINKIIKQRLDDNEIQQNVKKLMKGYSQLSNGFKIISDNFASLDDQVEGNSPNYEQEHVLNQEQQFIQRRQDESKNCYQIVRRIDIHNWINKEAKFHDRLKYRQNIITSEENSCSAIFGKTPIKGRYNFIVYIQKMGRQCSVGFIVPEFYTSKKNCLRIWSKLIYRDNGKFLVGQEKVYQKSTRFLGFGEKSQIEAIIDTNQGSIQWRLDKMRVLKTYKNIIKDQNRSWVPFVHGIGSYQLILSQVIV